MATTCLSFCSNLMPGGMGFVTDPLGPVTTTVSGFISMFTLSGTGIGCLPILDTLFPLYLDPPNGICFNVLFSLLAVRSAASGLINVAKHFAPETLLACLLARHDAVRRR